MDKFKLRRNKHGQFTPNERKLRRLYLSDEAWDILGDKAANKNMTRDDMIEIFCKK